MLRRLLVATLALPACLAAQARITRDKGALFQTDSLRYRLRAADKGYDGEIGVTFTNRTSGTVYITNCHGATAVSLEKRVAGDWKNVWSPPIPLCLSPPITVPAGATYRTRIWIFGGYPEVNTYPKFSVTDIAGEYRAVWGQVLSSYQTDSLPFGAPLPMGHRVSNRFLLETERR
jgi:hypothetical protein